MTTTQEKALTTLVEKFGQKDWFHSIEIDPQFGKDIVLYTKNMNADIMNEVPTKCEDTRVMLAFAAYKEVKQNVISLASITSIPALTITTTEPTTIIETAAVTTDATDTYIEKVLAEVTKKPEVKKVENVATTIEGLIKQCKNKANLKNIFWELRDIENKEKPITNFSAEYPKVKTELSLLYNSYGFDKLAELLG